MNNKHYRRNLWVITIAVLAALIAAGALLWNYLKTQNIQLLQPKGTVGTHELNLMIFAALLSLIVIIPVFTIAIFIAFKYNENNKKAKYSPNWDTNHTIEFIWWGIPIFLILVVATVTWLSTHYLDPYKPLDETKPSTQIEVIALDWKWLFIYPDQDIATVNYVKFPVDTQINFTVTADAPMNSFWIPQLGGQIYAMPGMVTHQYLNATSPGTFAGSSANISGPGFAGMKFKAHAISNKEFTQWVEKTKTTNHDVLSMDSYNKLAKPSKNNPEATYSAVDGDIFSTVTKKYMNHTPSHHEMNTDDHQSMPMEKK